LTLLSPPRAAAVAVCLVGAFFLVRALRPPTPAEDDAGESPTEVDVQVGTVQRATLHAYITAYGRIEPEPATTDRASAQALVSASVAGRIVEAPCVEGQVVESGALLFQLDSRLADLAVENTRSAVDFAQKNVERQHALAKVEGTSEKLVLEAEQALNVARAELGNAETQQSLLRITAPIAGTVTRVVGKPGQPVDPSTVLAEVVDLDRIVVAGSIPSAEAVGLALGQTVEVTADNGTLAATGSLLLIAPRVDAVSDSVPVRVSLPAATRLRSGQFVRLRIVTGQREGCLAVPVESIVRVGDESVVAVVEGDTARQQAVHVGLRDGELVEVDGAGLREGMTVVTSGAYGLPKETKVRVLGKQ
jgi:membrane fusion protein, multidrug efflux system